jgi:hypothetical protein
VDDEAGEIGTAAAEVWRGRDEDRERADRRERDTKLSKDLKPSGSWPSTTKFVVSCRVFQGRRFYPSRSAGLGLKKIERSIA